MSVVNDVGNALQSPGVDLEPTTITKASDIEGVASKMQTHSIVPVVVTSNVTGEGYAGAVPPAGRGSRGATPFVCLSPAQHGSSAAVFVSFAGESGVGAAAVAPRR